MGSVRRDSADTISAWDRLDLLTWAHLAFYRVMGVAEKNPAAYGHGVGLNGS